MLLTDKYAPKKLDDLIGNEDAMAKVKQWLFNWLRGQKKRALLIHGPPGIGKTAIAHTIMAEHDFELVEMSSSDVRNKANIGRVLNGALLAGSLFGRKKILLVDDADTIGGRADYGGMTELARVIRESSVPIIITALDAWDKNLAPIRMECELVPMKKVSKANIVKLLQKIAAVEKITVGNTRLEDIAANCDGDVRSALNDLQANSNSLCDREKDIFERVRAVFKARSYIEAKKANSGDVDYNLLKLWIDENIANEYETVEDAAMAYYYLSRADIFDGRIKNTNWGYLKYSIDLATCGVALAKKDVYRKFTKYNFPKYLREMSRTVERRAMLKRIGLKIGAIVHCNRKDALEYVEIVKGHLKTSPEQAKKFYNLEDEEALFISSSP